MRAKVIITPCLLLLLAGTGTGIAGTGDELERELHARQEQILRLQAGLGAQQEQLNHSQAKESDLLGELNRIDQELQDRRLHRDEVQEKLTRQKQLTGAKELEVESSTRQHQRLRQQIQGRLRAFARLGELGVLNALFATTSLPELISFELNFRQLLRHDQAMIARYRAQLLTLTGHRQTLAAEEKKLSELLAQLQASEEELLASRQERERLLERVKSEELLYRHALREIEEATNLLGSTITQLLARDPGPSAARRPPGENPAPARTSFAAQKGFLPPPASGPVSSTFGSTPGKFGATTQARGITFQAPPGSELRAVFPGTVAYAGPLKGYGQIVIVDHGQNYFSLIGRMGRISCAEGREVRAGEPLGRMGEATGLLEEGAHFEIRHGSEAVDPLPWLAPGSLSTPAAKPR